MNFRTLKLYLFQSIYSQSGRWNLDKISLKMDSARGFNPFIPKAGVGIQQWNNINLPALVFQSIYSQSGRWNPQYLRLILSYLLFQSIYSQSGRWNKFSYIGNEIEFQSFNPFIPKAGVGIVSTFLLILLNGLFQSIYSQSGRWNKASLFGLGSCW